MKLKRILIKSVCILSVLFLAIPIILDVYFNCKKIFRKDAYDDRVRNVIVDEKKAEGDVFSDDIFGFLRLDETFEDFVVCNKTNKENILDLKRDLVVAEKGENSFILTLDEESSFSDVYSKLMDVKFKDRIYLDVFGISKIFEVSNIKLVRDFDRKKYIEFKKDVLTICLNLPFKVEKYRFIIECRKIGEKKISSYDNVFLMFLKNRYLVILYIFTIFVLIIIYISNKKFSINIAKRSDRKKYVVGIFNFE